MLIITPAKNAAVIDRVKEIVMDHVPEEVSDLVYLSLKWAYHYLYLPDPLLRASICQPYL